MRPDLRPADAPAAEPAGFPAIGPGRVHRWGGAGLLVARRLDLHRAPPPLSSAERRVVHALPAWRQAEWTAGRLLAKRLVHETVGASPREVEILPRADGSPYVLIGGSPPAGLHLSISHTARHVAAALAPQPVGVDLCETSSADAVRRVADQVLTPGELSLIGTDRPEVLAAAWALKEAAVKADRSGIFGAAPRRIVILGLWPPLLDGPRRAVVWQTADAALALVLAHPATSPHCVGAPCRAGSCLSVEPLASEGEMSGDGATSHPSR
ncbi:4'-phosphopantetheinyl transferase superfamily protein [Streptomyces sp. H27-H1]|uniref:4'-phosphopantetheinyl transferase family protein n=1 Tax=Streptomyces sp. H27-H1 TaxID=2996461 RepID=UPI00226E1D8D|nr:4'-phosphopantetheinyl transferase superfamily protein [Streptomyces sp. H27-H1]MCY0926343.1 4'-phosphopantetheinyl transferase superfamily protein [Streptomyces sp. H27-H1]